MNSSTSSSTVEAFDQMLSKNEQGVSLCHKGDLREGLRAFSDSFKAFRSIAKSANSTRAPPTPLYFLPKEDLSPMIFDALVREHFFAPSTTRIFLHKESLSLHRCLSARLQSQGSLAFLTPMEIPHVLLDDHASSSSSTSSSTAIPLIVMLNAALTNHMIAANLSHQRNHSVVDLSSSTVTPQEKVYLRKAIQLYCSARDLYSKGHPSLVQATVDHALCPHFEILICANLANAYEMLGSPQTASLCYQRMVCLIRSVAQLARREAQEAACSTKKNKKSTASPTTTKTDMYNAPSVSLSHWNESLASLLMVPQVTKNDIFDRLIRQAALNFLQARGRAKLAEAA